jgi:hypothetical protein
MDNVKLVEQALRRSLRVGTSLTTVPSQASFAVSSLGNVDLCLDRPDQGLLRLRWDHLEEIRRLLWRGDWVVVSGAYFGARDHGASLDGCVKAVTGLSGAGRWVAAVLVEARVAEVAAERPTAIRLTSAFLKRPDEWSPGRPVAPPRCTEPRWQLVRTRGGNRRLKMPCPEPVVEIVGILAHCQEHHEKHQARVRSIRLQHEAGRGKPPE